MDPATPANVPLNELLALTAVEKIALIGVLWDSIEESKVPIPAWQLEELDRRDTEERPSSEPTMSWEEAQHRARSAHAQPRSA